MPIKRKTWDKLTIFAVVALCAVAAIGGCADRPDAASETSGLSVPTPTPSPTQALTPSPSPTGSEESFLPETALAPGFHEIVPPNRESRFDLDGDGAEDTFLTRNEGWSEPCILAVSGAQAEFSTGAVGRLFLLRTEDNATALVICTYSDDNYAVTHIFTYADGTVTLADFCYMDIAECGMDSGKPYIRFEGGLRAIGNQGTLGSVVLNDDFTMNWSNGEWLDIYALYDGRERHYTSLTDIPLKRLKNGAYEDAVLPAGTVVAIYQVTRDAKSARIKAADGGVWLVEFDEAHMLFPTIGGIPDSELFDGVGYAGA
jgi:hypothetical protein